MMADNSVMIREPRHGGEGLGVVMDRIAPPSRIRLPAGTVVVSADDHLSHCEDIWFDAFPAHFRDKAPRVWFDEPSRIYHLGFNSPEGLKSTYPDGALPMVRSMELAQGGASLDGRIRDMDAESVAKQILFPQTLMMFFNYPDFEVREWVFKLYNRHLADIQQQYPGRLYGVAIPNYWDMAKAAESVREIKNLGLKAILFPSKPGKTPDGESIWWSKPEMAPLMAAVAESGLPLCFHVGEGFNFEGAGPNTMAKMGLFETGAPYFRLMFGDLMFGGVFDRHPDLKIVFTEGGIAWVPGMLQDAQKLYHAFDSLHDFVPPHPVSHYWQRNCWATFMTDPAGLANIDRIGSDKCMWSSDYPHNEGTFGYSEDAMQQVLDAVSDEVARKILGQTAIDLFDLR
jgi:predicted TIM-barrel fold metal-dependent hydrolase